MLIGIGGFCCISYSVVTFSYSYVNFRLITLLGKERAYLPLSFICNFVVSARSGFFFFSVLGIGCVILLWQSLGLPYIFFEHVIL